jgi:hypothetical protein
MRPHRRLLAAATASLLSLTACQSGGDDADCAGAKCDGFDAGEGSLCAAVRGNGERIPAHFASLARIIEHYGMLDGIAGGSSGSVTSFLYESIAISPAVARCGSKPCSAPRRAARAALLFKSLEGYLEVVASGPEASALRHLMPLVAELKAQGLGELAARDVEAARDALLTLLESDDLRGLINPELVELVATSPDPAFHVRDVIAGIEKLGAFEADDVRIFLRPGLIDWDGFAELVGRVGSFYAGYGPFDQAGMDKWAAACAEPGVGKTWPEVAALPFGDGTCGAAFAGLVGDYRAALAASPGAASRADDEVGRFVPVLITTSVLDGDGAEAMNAARAAYRAGQVPTLTVSFADVGFGYFGQPADVERVTANPLDLDDLKTAKGVPLGAATWRQVLALSPAEPGLSAVRDLPDGRISAGGWSDLHPVQALESLGCERTVYVTREGGESRFAEGVARLLGMTDGERDALYDLGDAGSSYAQAIARASAVWCTDWNAGSADPAALARAAYAAPMETSDPFFTAARSAYPGAAAGLGKVGCTPGVQ